MTSETAIENLREGILLGMGNPLLDVSASVDDSVLEKYKMKPNDAILADDKIHNDICQHLIDNYETRLTAGGSVQNSLRVAQWLVEKPKTTTFFGCVGDDNYASKLKDKALESGVDVRYQYKPDHPTGTCAVLITGTNRSLCADLGAANCFTIDHLKDPDNWKMVEKARFYYVSGFFLTVSPDSILEIAKHALANNKMFIHNLSAAFISQHYKAPLLSVMPYVDILFGNEEEAEAFATAMDFGTVDRRAIALKICALPKENESRRRIVVITQGTKPVIVADAEGGITEYPVTRLPAEKIVDTNGAGDAFVGGFLSQLIQQRPIDVCIRCAIYTATEIIQQPGCTYVGKHRFEA